MSVRRRLIRTKNVAFFDVASATLELHHHRTHGDEIPPDLQAEHEDAVARYVKALHVLHLQQERRAVEVSKAVERDAQAWAEMGPLWAAMAHSRAEGARVTKPPAARTCPECGGVLRLKDGKYGRFVGCANYPSCRHTESASQ